MSKKNEATSAATSAVATYDPGELPVPFEDLEADAGSGAEEVTGDDISTPFLKIIQTNSPEVDSTSGKYHPDLKPGFIYNGLTFDMWGPDMPLRVVPCYFRSEYVEWKLREKGGAGGSGFVRVYTPEDAAPLLETCVRDEKNRDVLPNGETYLQKTAMHYVLTESGSYAVVAMASTQLKKSRGWNTMMTTWKMPTQGGGMVNPPTFARFYELSTVPESNDKGKWFGWKITPGGFVSPELYGEAKKFKVLVAEGGVRVVEDVEDEPDATVHDAEGDAPGF